MRSYRFIFLSAPRSLGWFFTFFTASLLCVGCAKKAAPGAAKDEPKMVTVTEDGERVELFLEHPYVVKGEKTKFNVHFTVVTDGMPVRSGKLTAVAKGPSGKTVTVEQEAPKSPGIFGPVVEFPETGKHELSLTLETGVARETFHVPITVYPNHPAAEKAAEEGEEKTDGAITFAKEQAWKVGLVHQTVSKRRLVERLTVPGEILPAAGAKAVVTPPISGRLLPPLGAVFPRVGESVRAGQVVAIIEPPAVGPEGAQMFANRAQLHTLEADLEVKLKAVEIDMKKAKIDLDHARIQLERIRSASTQGAIAERQVREAEKDYQLAETTHQGKVNAHELYVQARHDLRLMLRSVALGSEPGETHNADAKSPERFSGVLLRAPLSGTITAAQATEGEFVNPTRSLFTVINLGRVWVEAKVSEFDVERVVKAPAANFTLGAYPGRRFTMLGQDGGKLIDVGSVVDPSSRTLPVRYEVKNPERLLRVGMFADVAIETVRTEEALAIPESAIVDEDGRPTAYVLLDGEHFQKRDLELGVHDSGYVEVKEGLKAGERVVTRGGYSIRLASVSAVIPAHGHTH